MSQQQQNALLFMILSLVAVLFSPALAWINFRSKGREAVVRHTRIYVAVFAVLAVVGVVALIYAK